MTKNEKFLNWNGVVQTAESLAINPLSEAWLYGCGCFETMSFDEKGIRFLDGHWERLAGSVGEMGLTLSLTSGQLEESVRDLSGRNGISEGIARLSLHGDGSRTDWMLRVFERSPSSPKGLRIGISRFPHPGASPLSRWKNNNYLLNLLAFREAQAGGLDEALLVRGDELVEGARSNLWILQNGELLTPPLTSGALPGVTRREILRSAEEIGVKIREKTLRREDIDGAEGVFLSSAGLLFAGVSECEGISYPVQEKIVKKIKEVLLDRS